MPHLLHIDASALTQGSVSREVASTFRATWTGSVTYRDLGTDPVPHLTASGISSRFTPGEARTPEQIEAAALQDTLVDELLAADAYLFAVPMYNWAAPSTFKAWLDHVLIVGRTMGQNPSDSPLAGRPATVISSKGGGYGPGTPMEGWDFVDPYLTKVLSGKLGLDVNIISAELTLAERVPAMESLRGLAADSLAKAHEAARHRAKALAAV
jgi:FMN-dependent NADH-azoreductase